MDKSQKIYDRQIYDTQKSWAAFCTYRDMGVGRSLEKAAKNLYQNYSKTTLRYFANWSSKHKWVERCRAFDADELSNQSIALQKIRLKRRLEIERAAAVRIGIEQNVSPHWLRHCHASHSLDRGAPISLVQSTLGHSSVATTSKYLHAKPNDSSARYLAV